MREEEGDINNASGGEPDGGEDLQEQRSSGSEIRAEDRVGRRQEILALLSMILI